MPGWPCVLRQAEGCSRSDDCKQLVDAQVIDQRHLWKPSGRVRVSKTVGTYRQVEDQKERLVEAASFSSEAMLLKNYANSADRDCGSCPWISSCSTTPTRAQPHAHAVLCASWRWAVAG